MKNATLAFLCCSAFLTACDNSGDTNGEGESLLDKASSLASDATNAAKNAGEEMVGSLGDTLESAKSAATDAANGAVDSAKESAAAAVDTAKESVGTAVDGAMEASKEMASAAVEKSASVVAAVSTAGADTNTATNTATNAGESTYKNSCNACHGTGVAGSPKIGDTAAWSARIAQGNAVLIDHAIKGYQGEKGYMPPKGGFMNLSDEQVSAAVLYMVSKAQ